MLSHPSRMSLCVVRVYVDLIAYCLSMTTANKEKFLKIHFALHASACCYYQPLSHDPDHLEGFGVYNTTFHSPRPRLALDAITTTPMRIGPYFFTIFLCHYA